MEDRLTSDAICSCYAKEPVSAGQKRPGLVNIKENRCLTMAHSHVYSLRAESVYSSSSEKCTIGETRPNCDVNEPQEDAQGTRQIGRGRLNNETPDQRERRLQIQREQRRRRRHQETTEQRQHHLAQQRQRHQEETEEHRKRKLEYHRQYNQGINQLSTQP